MSNESILLPCTDRIKKFRSSRFFMNMNDQPECTLVNQLQETLIIERVVVIKIYLGTNSEVLEVTKGGVID